MMNVPWRAWLKRMRAHDPGGNAYWYTRYSKPVIFLIIILALAGIYLATTIPVSVFPTTDFPRVLIGVDNGVMPIDQMMVTMTRPIEEAVNSVPGLSTCAPSPAGDLPRSICFSLGHRHVPDAAICERRDLPGAAGTSCHGEDRSSPPDICLLSPLSATA